MSYARLSQLAFGHMNAQILYAAVRLGVPEALARGPVSPGEVADTVGCDPAGLARLLRALIVLGVAAEVTPGRVTLAELGRPLCADHPRSMRSSVLLLGHPATWQAWGALADGVRAGADAFGHAHGQPLFRYLADDAELSAVFNTAMDEGTEPVAAAVPRSYDFAAARTVVDVGGGNGTLLAAVLAAAPGACGILYDSDTGSAQAAATLRRPGLAGRVRVAAGDFFAAVPPGDLMLLKGILHDWDDERCLTILRNCRRSIAPDGRLLVLEPVLPDRLGTAEAAAAVMSDIAMLVYTGGRERTGTEFRGLLADGGFSLTEVTPPLAGSAIRILAAAPA